MQDKYIQDLRYKLQKRVRRLNSVEPRTFQLHLNPFIEWFNSISVLSDLRDELLKRAPEKVFSEDVQKVLSGQGWVGDTEVEAAALGHALILHVAGDPNAKIFRMMHSYGSVQDESDAVSLFREVFLEPFYEYIDEHLDDQQAILHFLRRYKHRSEWFHADKLRKRIEEDTQRGEKLLALDLYEYLHDEGIDFHIEPQSVSGIADLVTEQVGDERIVADAKVFWPDKKKGKPYLINAFNQAYTYARDYNESVAYLVIYKMCKEDIAFLFPNSDTSFPCLTTNNKTIFFIVVDICEYGATASKRKGLKTYEVTSDDLIQAAKDGSG